MEKLNTVIVGAGRAGGKLVTAALKQIPEINVIAICDLDIDRARKVSRENNIPHTYTSLKESLENHDAKLVCICTPPKSHLELSKMAIQNRCHILLEKPITISIRELDEIKKLQNDTGVKVGFIHNKKFLPGIQKALEIFNKGEIGEILHIDRTWMTKGDNNLMISDSNCWCHKLPGGRWAENLVHMIYTPYLFVGKMKLKNVAAKKTSGKWPWLIADEVEAVLESKTGYVNIRLSANLVSPYKKGVNNLMILHGTKGILYCDYEDAYLMTYVSSQIKIKTKMKELFDLVAGGLKLKIRKGKKTSVDSGHLQNIGQFINHITKDETPPVSWEEAYHTVQLTEEIGLEIEKVMEKKMIED